MTCEEAVLLISGRMDGENTPQEEQLLQAHLEQCDRCRQTLQEFLLLDRALAQLETPPEGLRQNVMAAIDAEATGRKKRRRVRWTGLAAAAALALVMGIGALRLPAAQERTIQPEPMLSRAATPAEAALPAEYAMEEYAVAAQAAEAPLSYEELAESRQADVAVLSQSVPELEGCSSELLADGSMLYTLPQADGAVNLSRLYGAELYQPEVKGESNCSYALLPGSCMP